VQKKKNPGLQERQPKKAKSSRQHDPPKSTYQPRFGILRFNHLARLLLTRSPTPRLFSTRLHPPQLLAGSHCTLREDNSQPFVQLHVQFNTPVSLLTPAASRISHRIRKPLPHTSRTTISKSRCTGHSNSFTQPTLRPGLCRRKSPSPFCFLIVCFAATLDSCRSYPSHLVVVSPPAELFEPPPSKTTTISSVDKASLQRNRH
jgi:hypothetical protein